MTKFSWYFSEIGALGRPSAFADSKTTAIANCSEHMEIGCYEFGMNSMMSISSECRLAFWAGCLRSSQHVSLRTSKRTVRQIRSSSNWRFIGNGPFLLTAVRNHLLQISLCFQTRDRNLRFVSCFLWIQKIGSSRLEQCSKFSEIRRMIAEDR